MKKLNLIKKIRIIIRVKMEESWNYNLIKKRRKDLLKHLILENKKLKKKMKDNNLYMREDRKSRVLKKERDNRVLKREVDNRVVKRYREIIILEIII